MVREDRSPFDRIGPDQPVSPLVVSVPHAGRVYPHETLIASAVPIAVLEQLEDRHADLLIGHFVERGAVAIVARIARAWIDLNRGEEDIDPGLHGAAGGSPPSARARSGLGLVPRRVGRRELWRQPPDLGAVAARIALVHRPYHAAIATAVAAARRRHGHAVLLDCHSMPSLSGAHAPQVVIGDRHGTTAHGATTAAVADAARDAGYRVAINAPYAGAHTIARHGRPAAGIHALQIEVDRALYLAPDMRTTSGRLVQVQELLAALGQAGIAAAAPSLAVAAE